MHAIYAISKIFRVLQIHEQINHGKLFIYEERQNSHFQRKTIFYCVVLIM
jgi:hypothetical protein